MPVVIDNEILQSVEKPSRYTGNEWNMARKDPQEVDIRFAFCFPDIYDVGMSHLGMKILYHMLNERKDTYCERVFAPWVDMEQKMRENNIPLFSLETFEPLSNFHIVGFTLQYEMSYTNILNMLDLGGIPLRSWERTEHHPFVCAGGPCTVNPEPLADFIDFFVIGEGEEVINEVLDKFLEWKKGGHPRKTFLEMIASIEGVYVPSFYDVKYNEDGTVQSINPKEDRYPARIRKRIVKELNESYFPEKIIVPYTSIVHDRIMLEIFRGCSRGCRFCQAGFIYRPVRERSPERLGNLAEDLAESTGYDEISMVSLSTSDYSRLGELTEDLIRRLEDKKISLSLPSLRVDSFSIELMDKVKTVRKSGLTFAPEAGTQRLRNVINKGITEEDLVNSARIAFMGGWNNLKFYFMIGLPTETMEDIVGIARLGEKIVELYRSMQTKEKGKNLTLTISTSSFVPKPFTPFQWEAQDTMDALREKQKFLKSKLRRSITYNWHDPEVSFLEAVFARGDRRTGEVLLRAWQKGCKFDGWGEVFNFDKWMEAFEETGIDPAFYANRRREPGEVLPWDHIDVGVSKKYLIREREKAYREEVTRDCLSICSGCGVTQFGCGICMGY